MPFDPTLPVNNALIVASELRNQLNGLKAIIDAIPPGATVQQLNDAVAALNDDINNLAASTDAAISTRAINPTLVEGLGMVVSDPPTQAQTQALSDKLDELLAALKG